VTSLFHSSWEMLLSIHEDIQHVRSIGGCVVQVIVISEISNASRSIDVVPIDSMVAIVNPFKSILILLINLCLIGKVLISFN
jgi:hypothetical protein